MINKKIISNAVNVYGEHADKFVSLTLKDADNFFDAIHAAVSNKNESALIIAAHSLKSIMRQAGAHEVADEAFALEKMGKDGDFSSAAGALKKLSTLYVGTKKVLQELMKKK